MADFATAVPDQRDTRLALGVVLRDPVTRSGPLAGNITARVAGLPERGAYRWLYKPAQNTLLFFGLPNAAHVIEVRSDPLTPYYLPLDLNITVPFGTTARWPVFPDAMLANLSLSLDDPAQPLAYRTQRAEATLSPTPAYPFAGDVTLLRGTVFSGANPLAGATVRRTLDNVQHVTGNDGQYVLFFPRVLGIAQTFSIVVAHPMQGSKTVNVLIARDTATLVDFTLP